MTPDRNLKDVLRELTNFRHISDDWVDAIKGAIRKDQDEEHAFCKQAIRVKIEGKNVEGSTFNK